MLIAWPYTHFGVVERLRRCRWGVKFLQATAEKTRHDDLPLIECILASMQTAYCLILTNEPHIPHLDVRIKTSGKLISLLFFATLGFRTRESLRKVYAHVCPMSSFIGQKTKCLANRNGFLNEKPWVSLDFYAVGPLPLEERFGSRFKPSRSILIRRLRDFLYSF